MKQLIAICLLTFLCACGNPTPKSSVAIESAKETTIDGPYVQVLGVAQDAGYPQIGCNKSCCKDLWDDLDAREKVSCIGLINPATDDYWLFDATPDIKDQIEACNKSIGSEKPKLPNGVFLTHAHMGHYTGLMQFGREAYGSKGLPVYAMPRMTEFLSSNGPWDQLVSLKNITLQSLVNDESYIVSKDLKIFPMQVPHRDEYSETVGYKIIGPAKKVLFIPDIDKWGKWERNIIDEIAAVDVALLDGSFYRNGEIFGRDMSMIPHPFIQESMELFKDLPASEKSKITFIHFNHTNPVLQKGSEAYKAVINNGFNIAHEGLKIAI